MIVYVITSGCYSDYHIDAVVTDVERAEKLRRYFSDGWNEAQIEEYDTDAISVSGTPRRVWNFDITPNGSYCEGKEEWTYDDDYKNDFGFRRGLDFYAKVVADDKEMALKIARDERAKMLAEMFGL